MARLPQFPRIISASSSFFALDIRHSFPSIAGMKDTVMELVGKRTSSTTEVKDEVNLAAVITVIALVLFFIGASFYVVIDSYLEAARG